MSTASWQDSRAGARNSPGTASRPRSEPPIDSGTQPVDTTIVTNRDPARLFSLHAIDATTGEILWRSPLATPSYGDRLQKLASGPPGEHPALAVLGRFRLH